MSFLHNVLVPIDLGSTSLILEDGVIWILFGVFYGRFKEGERVGSSPTRSLSESFDFLYGT